MNRTKIDIKKEIEECDFNLYGERIAIVEEDVLTVGGLIIPDSSQKGGEMQTNEGYVVAVGDGAHFVEPGDKVFYGRYSGGWYFDKKYRIMNEEDLIGKRKNGDNNA